MAKTPINNGKQWTDSQEARLRKSITGNKPTPLIAYELGRSPNAIYSKAHELNLSLHPTNKSPYNRRKKNA